MTARRRSVSLIACHRLDAGIVGIEGKIPAALRAEGINAAPTVAIDYFSFGFPCLSYVTIKMRTRQQVRIQSAIPVSERMSTTVRRLTSQDR